MTSFYISWTKLEPEFQQYDTSCNILLSPSLLRGGWNCRMWEHLPKRLMIDSGVYTAQGKLHTSEVLHSQRKLAEGSDEIAEVFFPHADQIIPPGLTFAEEQAAIRENMKRAHRYLREFRAAGLQGTPVGVIHAFDEESMYYCYRTLSSMGYRSFGIGSLSVRSKKSKTSVKQVLETAINLGIGPLHIFGITLPFYTEDPGPGIISFDTSTPIRMAYNGSILYHGPLRRYILRPEGYQKERAHQFAFNTILHEPKPCSCPVCSVDPLQLISGSESEKKRNRMIHNYFQLRWELER